MTKHSQQINSNRLHLVNRCEQVSDAQVHALTQALPHFPATLARLCAARGVTHADELNLSLKKIIPAKELLGLDTALGLLDAAIDQQKNILIVGDFDCDGATSTALMMRVLGDMGAKVNFLVPDRFKFGYGLTPEIVAHGIELFSPALIITVDNGISSHAGVAAAHEAGVQVIITDHHLTTKPKPPADAVVNPNQLGCEFPSKALAGVGVAFYVLASLAKQRRQAGKTSTQVTQHLDLVALGTVADVAMLDANNRRLVAQGLRQINAGKACLGIQALMAQAGKKTGQGKQAKSKPLKSIDLGFVLAPRVNAAGRMDDMRIGIQCLLADDMETAQAYAAQLEQLNQTRRQVESQMRDEAMQMLTQTDLLSEDTHSDMAGDAAAKKSIVLYEPSWHQGVIGIVAGRLKERFYKPAIVFAPSDDTATSLKGSARSIAGVHIRDAIEQVAQENPTLISHFGGHAMAAGLTLLPENVTAFTEAFEAVLAGCDDDVFSPVTYTDGELTTTDFSLDFAEMLQQTLPWGQGFAAPLFDGVFSVTGSRVLKENHLKLWLAHPNQLGVLEAIWFNFAKDTWQSSATSVHLLYELSVNEYNGNKSLQLMVRDLAVVA